MRLLYSALGRQAAITRDGNRQKVFPTRLQLLLFSICVAMGIGAVAQGLPPATQPANTTPSASITSATPEQYKKMDLDQLMNQEVVSVAGTPQKLDQTPSAIQVITGDDIANSGAQSLPEALRLAPNLQVAQVNAHDWAISARGFNGAPLSNNALSDKLLVMIDGRSVYTPLFGGVFWDVQNVMLSDVDRIEVISGPGGTLWGANAVNGVINVVTKSSRDTQGLYLTGTAGSFWQETGAVQYGGQIGSDMYYRVYAQDFQHASTDMSDGASNHDGWDTTQGGFRTDFYPTEDNVITFQGDTYGGSEGDPAENTTSGGNLLARLQHKISDDSDFTAQMYFDNTWRSTPPGDVSDQLNTADFSFQHHFELGTRQNVLWGGEYRYQQDNVHDGPGLTLIPGDRNMPLYSAFVQDEITVVPDRVKVTVGTKLENNVFTGFEVEPSGRVAWTPDQRQTYWAAISRAVRTPDRFDTDLAGDSLAPQFKSETLMAYELGYRVRPIDPLSLSIATFYNDYEDIRSFNATGNPADPFVLENGQRAHTWGIELAAELQATSWWRLRGGYTFLNEHFQPSSPGEVAGSNFVEALDPRNEVTLQSMMQLPGHVQLDLIGRYVDSLPGAAITGTPETPAYFSLDAKLAWQYKNWEFSLVGQNLLEDHHREFGAVEIPRSFYGKVAVSW